MYAFLLSCILKDFGGAFSQGLGKNPTHNSANERQAAHGGKRQNGVNTRHLNDKRAASRSDTTRNIHHDHAIIPRNKIRVKKFTI